MSMCRWNWLIICLFLILLLAELNAVRTQDLIRRVQLFDKRTPSKLVNRYDLPGQSKLSTVVERAKKAAFSGGLYGAIAGTFQVLSLMWLRTVINYQYRYGGTMKEAFSALYIQGGVKRFYKGLTYALIQNPLAKFGSVAANEASRVLIDQSNRFSPLYTSAVGTFLSVLWRVLIVPLETCKTVLQVDGSEGFVKLIQKLKKGDALILYHGTSATIASTFFSHYPWFLVYHWLDRVIPSHEERKTYTVIRHGCIGFLATAFSDTVSNFLRIIKTMKQSLAAGDESGMSYEDIIFHLYNSGGISSLLTRGLPTRIVANGLQNFIFTVVWKLLPLYLESKSPDAKTQNAVLEDTTIEEDALENP